MTTATVQGVDEGSPAAAAGVQVGDEIVTVCGEALRDVIQYRTLTDGAEVALELRRGGLELDIDVEKPEGTPLGITVSAAVFDEIRTCDNHCEFCFIYQLPPGMRTSLYLKDDDYRLSFLYGNFTTLTRFTEADLERVLTDGLSPLYVSIHATDPLVRVEMLRNRRGATSLRWLRALLDHGVEVHGQIVVCPGRNDGAVLEDTLQGIADEYPELADVALVPLGVSRFNREPGMRPHTPAEARAVIDSAERWQDRFLATFGRRMVFASDEFYLVAGRPLPDAATYGDFEMHEDGIGMIRAFEAEFLGARADEHQPQSGFFSWVDGAPAEGYRNLRWSPTTEAGVPERLGPSPSPTPVALGARRTRSSGVTILTGEYAAAALRHIITPLVSGDVDVRAVANDFFGGNTAVAGLMVGEDLQRAVALIPEDRRILLPDVCLSGGRFLDGLGLDDLGRSVEVVETSGTALRRALGEHLVAPAGVK